MSEPKRKTTRKSGPKSRRKPIRKIYSPMVWPTWLLVGFAWLLARLPITALFWLGDRLGTLGYAIGGSRRDIVDVNLRLCFPELDDEQRETMARKVFQEVCVGALEMMIPWLNPKKDLSSRFEIDGREHYEQALAQGRGVVLIGGHFAVMDVISQALQDVGSIDLMYRYNKNPVWEWLQVSGRKHFFDGVVEREDIRQVLKRLKRGRAIWYAPDQDYGRKHSVFAPFFGIQAATIIATSRFARLNNSPVLTLTQARERDRKGWRLTFSPVVEGFPSGDDEQDAQRMNTLLEAQIRKHPEQYLWLHKRFKTRPEGEASFYS